MSLHKYIDLLVHNDDLLLDAGGEPAIITDQDTILQDTKHLIRDSGLLTRIIGQRDNAIVESLIGQLEVLIEEDTRLIPGTIHIERKATGLFFVTANTYDYGGFELEVTV